MDWNEVDEESIISEIIYAEDPHEKIETMLYSSEESDIDEVVPGFQHCPSRFLVRQPGSKQRDILAQTRKYLSNIDKHTLVRALKMSPQVLSSIMAAMREKAAPIPSVTFSDPFMSDGCDPWTNGEVLNDQEGCLHAMSNFGSWSHAPCGNHLIRQ